MTNFSKPDTNPSRRAFLKRASALSMLGAAAPWAMNLAAMSEASAAGATDYKAIVCIFLLGGNDYANTVTPYDAPSYNAYQAMRPSFAHTQAALAATVLKPGAAPVDSAGVAHQYALAPALAPILPLFDSGKLGVIMNVGTLIGPTTKAQWNAKSVKLPAKLFSHNDQQSTWQSSAPEGARSGWGGRIGDLFESGNTNSTFTCVNVTGNAIFLSGASAVQYQVSTNGSVPLNGLKSPLFGSSIATEALRTLITEPRTHLLESEYNRVAKRSVDANTTLTGALAGSAALTTVFPTGNGLSDQLKMVARMIGAAPALGAKRQVFFVALGGFDLHDGMAATHPKLMKTVADAMAAFYASTVELGVAENVTAFTASDFGRTMVGNGDGADHGWGSMHFVMGGAVKGQNLYGTAPVVANNGVDDVGSGRLLPTTSVDQLAATLGKWMGISDSNLLTMLPNLSNWDAAKRTMAFL